MQLAGLEAARYVDAIAWRGGTVAATAVIGGPIGALISFGATGQSFSEHAGRQSELEARVGAFLEAYIATLRDRLQHDPCLGVLQGVEWTDRAVRDGLLSTVGGRW
jgi:hypothetical protein